MVYLSISLNVNWCVQVSDAFKQLGEENNFDVSIADGGLNPETQLTQLDQYIAQGVDAVVIMLSDTGMAQAVADRCAEANVVLLGETTYGLGDDGKLLYSYNYLDDAVGRQMTQWVIDNHDQYGFDFSDMSKVGFMTIINSIYPQMVIRDGFARDAWKAAFPDFPDDQMYTVDVASAVGTSSTMEAAYNTSAAVLTSNTQYDYWVIIAINDDYAMGVVRAIQDLSIVDKCMVVSDGGELTILSGMTD
jgi:ABC-type sugar transport system substrate-binding protein